MLNVVNNLFCAGTHVQTMAHGCWEKSLSERKKKNEETPALELQVTGTNSAFRHQERLMAESSSQVPPELWAGIWEGIASHGRC